MSSIAIKAEGLSKAYKIGVTAERHDSLRTALSHAAAAPWRLMRNSVAATGAPARDDVVWALENVSFDVAHGHAYGIIGRNGAGKSTLLKILSRITRPTAGQARVFGRVGSLLEVGTGFHPELTGRDNVYLNGSILGMDRRFIDRKFDEIVDFAGVARFIDTPVKRYSSGMYLRLAFAVAAHLEPEILIIDEVLAVGDAEFQAKCLRRMGEVTGEGRTVLFVSHNMSAVARLCQRGLLLRGGRLALEGTMDQVVTEYMRHDDEFGPERCWLDAATAPGDDVARLLAIRVRSGEVMSTEVDITRPVTIELDYETYSPHADLFAAASFVNDRDDILFVSADWHDAQWGRRPRPAGRYHASCTVPGNLFAEGQIRVTAELSSRRPHYVHHVLLEDAITFEVIDRGEAGSVRGDWHRPISGLMRPFLEWQTRLLPPARTATSIRSASGRTVADIGSAER